MKILEVVLKFTLLLGAQAATFNTLGELALYLFAHIHHGLRTVQEDLAKDCLFA